jgi:uncharacterized Zn finger protein
MARKVTTICDRCGNEGEVDVVDVEIKPGNDPLDWHKVDLCGACDSVFRERTAIFMRNK